MAPIEFWRQNLVNLANVPTYLRIAFTRQKTFSWHHPTKPARCVSVAGVHEGLRLRVTTFTLLLILLAAAPVAGDYKSAKAAHRRGDYQYAFLEFARLAEKGNPKAQEMLASMYESGAGIQRDYAEAFKWYSSAARKGQVTAQFMVAQMYYEGKGGPKDFNEAINWYTVAARGGHVYAQYNLGILYALGRGLKL